MYRRCKLNSLAICNGRLRQKLRKRTNGSAEAASRKKGGVDFGNMEISMLYR